MNRSIGYALATSFLALTPTLMATPRSPLGVYAVVNVTEYVNVYLGINPMATPADVENYFINTVYPDLLNNPTVSGIALYETWARLNPSSPSTPNPYDWSLIDDLFDEILVWNLGHLTQPGKTVQLVLLPGFNSPPWVLNLTNSCNFLFDRRYPEPTEGICGTATFWGFKEGGVVGGSPVPMDLPLPWDPTYKAAWQTFLTTVAGKYGSKGSLVSISVAGPTASSEEMILPSKQSIVSGAVQIGGLTPEEMWEKLLAHRYSDTKYHQTDLAFIDEWAHAIDMYGKTFSGITLIVTTGDGLPNLNSCHITSSNLCSTFTLPTDPTIPFATVCPGSSVAPGADMDCAAETSILAYFSEATVGGANAKATQTDGMKGSGSTAFNLGVPSVKLISENTDVFTLPSERVLGGAQFAMAFSKQPVQEGCTSVFPPPFPPNGYASPDDVPVAAIPAACLNPALPSNALATAGFTYFDQKKEAAYLISPEQAEYNVLNWYFNGTGLGAFFGGPSAAGAAPMNYVQIYGPDISYATMNAATSVQIIVSGTPVMITAQELLSLMSEAIGVIAEVP